MKDSTKRLIIILGSFTLLVAILYLFFSKVMTSFSGIQVLRAEKLAKEILLENQDEAERKIGELFKQYSGLSKTQEALSLILPIGSNTPTLMNQIQGIARNNLIQINSLFFQYLPIKQSGREIVNGVGTLRVSLSLSGTYDSFKSFISQLETNVRIIDVDNMRVEGGAVPRKDVFSYNLLIDAYYQEP